MRSGKMIVVVTAVMVEKVTKRTRIYTEKMAIMNKICNKIVCEILRPKFAVNVPKLFFKPVPKKVVP